MHIYMLKRLGLAVLVALAVSMIAFGLLRLSGDPAIAIAGEGATQADIVLVRQTYGFDRPLPVQYAEWLGRTLRGDLGESIYFKTPAAPLILSKLQTTLVLLDEPTTGLDPGSRLELWEAIRQLVAGGTDVLLTTQYLEEADHLARDVIIIDHGKVIASGTPNELKSRSGRDVIEIHPARQEDLAAVAAIVQSVIDHDVHVEQESLEVTAAIDDAAQFAAIVRAVTDSGIDLDDIAKRRPTLDEVFLGMTGRPASETPTTEGAAA